MKFNSPNATIFVPDGSQEDLALRRTTHLGISAHQDDLEIMAIDGILHCYRIPDQWFTGVVLTDGRGSPRTGIYANFSDDEMQQARQVEQKTAAMVGEYAAQVLLNYPSSAIKNSKNTETVEDLENLLLACKPDVVYTHNLADKHDTHVAAALRVLQAIRNIPAQKRPSRLLGGEVWRNLDWLMDEEKVAFDLSAQENLQAALLGLFDSQISGGKRYDLATMGRRRANATYYASHGIDTATGMGFAMDLTPLVKDDKIDVEAYVSGSVDRFAQDVRRRLSSFR